MNKEIETLLSEQLSSWETAQNNYAALKRVRIKDVKVNGCLYRIQFNPARIVSSAAKVDSKSIQERKCFLCPANLPSQFPSYNMLNSVSYIALVICSTWLLMPKII